MFLELPEWNRYQSETALVLMMMAVACAIPGVFLVLRRLVMVSDAISHVLLFGIVVAYLWTRDLASPWLVLGAAASGVLTVAIVELLQRGKQIHADAAVGLTFPALFSVGVILASMYTRNTHLDVDQVLLGFAEYAPLDRLVVGEISVPRGFILGGGFVLVNALLVVLFFKELQLTSFDPGLAATLGFLPGVLHYGLMTIVSLTAVTAFDAVGPVLVVAFFAVPPATAYLLTDRLERMLLLSALLAAAAAYLGVVAAFAWNTTIAGTTTSVLGLMFALVFLLAPDHGVLARSRRRWQQRREFHTVMLTIHLIHHENTPAEAEEARRDGLHRHLRWAPEEVTKVVHRAEQRGWITIQAGVLRLTSAGREIARSILGQNDSKRSSSHF
jgi:manganese/zinc/iron transport system permease protein